MNGITNIWSRMHICQQLLANERQNPWQRAALIVQSRQLTLNLLGSL